MSEVVVYVVGSVPVAEEAGTLNLVREAFPGEEIEFCQCPVSRRAVAPSAIVSSAIGQQANYILVCEVFTEVVALQELIPLAEAAQGAREDSGERFKPLVLAPIRRGEELVLARIIYCGAVGWVLRFYEKREDTGDDWNM
ncbi:MAG: hypothetical protein OEV37_00040 [Candidatus Berkelbacteria bacterium]|nr:hypothetical protein [Candidatus Berkelbacteria bacterium]